MKRTAAIFALCLVLFSTAFVAGKGPARTTGFPDSLRSVYLYTEGIKQNAIAGDSLRAKEFFLEAVRRDSAYAPAWYELAAGGWFEPAEAVEMARRAYRLDTANKWYHQFYGQTLLLAERYGEALQVFRDLRERDPKNPDTYRILAALYDQAQMPFSAIATLDSAELRFGRIPLLSAMKRRMLVATNQLDKAIDEARALVETDPYEDRHHVVLADLYALAKQDSLALGEYDRALQIDSTNLATLGSLADFYNSRHDYRALLNVTKRMFLVDAMPLEAKVDRFEQLTADTRFYREFYFQLNDLASTLAIRYPRDRRVVELYANHLIASGELDEALALYKLHLGDTPPVESYYRSVIDIESYLKRPDSVDRYVTRALELFPGKAEFHLAKGNVLNYTGQYDDAIEAYKRSLRHAATDSLRSVVWGLIGDTWHRQAEATEGHKRRKAVAESYKAYDRSLCYQADNTLVLNNYAYFLAVEGRDLERALEMSSRVVALTDNNPTYLDTHAWVLFRLGRTAEARKIMQQAVSLDTQQSPELLLHYGDILDALGERFLAEVYWRKALEKGYDASEIARRIESGKKE
ncbi:tetratricopeptide repeat protein [Alistipes sp.]|uniref:tetratricopeptide repeat protein n=1 Tax=Alistipes sp. TaxID=1872444 RepID=UPI003AF1817A